MKYFIDHFDVLGQTANIKISGKDKLRSNFTLGFSIILILIICTISFILAKYFIQKHDFNIYYSKIHHEKPKLNINLNKSPISVTLLDSNGNEINSNKTYSISITHDKILKNNTFIYKNSNTVKLEKCNKLPNYTLEKLPSLSDNYLCLPIESLSGKYGDVVNGYEYLNVSLSKCDSNYEDCLDEDVLEKKLSNVYIYIKVLNYYFDHNNYTNPEQPYLHSFLLKSRKKYNSCDDEKNINTYGGNIKCNNDKFNTKTKNEHFNFNLNIKEINYKSDNGKVFEDIYEKKFVTFKECKLCGNSGDNNNNNIYSTIKNNNNFSSNLLGSILISTSSSITIYNRSFSKIQISFAYIGGFSYITILIFYNFSKIILRRRLEVDIFNHEKQIFSNMIQMKRSSAKIIRREGVNSVINKDNKNLKLQTSNLNFNNPPDDYLNQKIELSILEAICIKKCVRNKRKLNFIDEINLFINKQISIENILRSFYDLRNMEKQVDSFIKNSMRYDERKNNINNNRDISPGINNIDFSGSSYLFKYKNLNNFSNIYKMERLDLDKEEL